MNNYKVVLKYDGTKYSGWQKNKNATNTIEEKIESMLSKLLEEKIEIIGSGRTDKGVHATGQVANFKTTKNLNCERMRNDMNKFLPDDIGVISIVAVPLDFHSRLHAKSKCYSYTFHKTYKGTKPVFERKYVAQLEQSIDLYKVNKGIELLLGEHDFKGFCSDKTKKSTVRRIDEIRVIDEDDLVKFEFVGNGFLHHMVRILMGTLIEIGAGQRKIDTIKYIFDSKDRSKAGFLAPSEGLCLAEVRYE